MIRALQMSPSKRTYFVLMALINLLLLGLIVGAYQANSLLTSRAAKLTELKAKSQALDQEQISLIKSKKDVQTYSDLAKIARSVVPQDKDQAEAVREIVNIAAANNVSLSAITFPASTLGAGITSTTGSGSTTPSPTPPKVTASTGKLSQLLPVKNISGVYSLAINVQGDPNKPVRYNSFINFLSSLEHNRRTAQISAITLQPSNTSSNLLSFKLTLNEYIKP